MKWQHQLTVKTPTAFADWERPSWGTFHEDTRWCRLFPEGDSTRREHSNGRKIRRTILPGGRLSLYGSKPRSDDQASWLYRHRPSQNTPTFGPEDVFITPGPKSRATCFPRSIRQSRLFSSPPNAGIPQISTVVVVQSDPKNGRLKPPKRRRSTSPRRVGDLCRGAVSTNYAGCRTA